MKLSKNLFIAAVVSISMIACQSGLLRKPASDDKGNTLAGRRINPVQYKQEIYTVIHLHDGSENNWAIGKLNLKKFDISDPAQSDIFYKTLLSYKEKNETEKKRTGKKNGFLPKGALRALKEAISLNEIFRQPDARNRMDAAIHMAEVIASFNYNFQYPVKDQYWILAFPFQILANLDNPIMSDKARVATNLDPADQGKPVSERDPVDSTFWKKPGKISEKNMFYAFNGSANPRFDNPCTYDGPKDGFGTHGGIEIICDGKKWKIKFGNESKTEPFNARIFWALGYNATPVHYIKEGLRVNFDPKIISEYNSRKELSVRIKSLAGFTYVKKNLQPELNPFVDGIAGALLKNGEYITSTQLENRYQSLQNEIQYLVMREGSMEQEDDSLNSLGPWGWTDFDHRDRRELRAFGVIAAFLNLFDMRTDNNRLRVREETDGSKTLLHYVSDLGSGLGIASNLLHNKNGVFNELPWQFIRKRPAVKPNPGQKGGAPIFQSPYELVKYNVLQENETFRRAQLDDARWATRMLAQLSEDQIQDALIAAGLEAAEVKLVLEKLLSRRQGMIKTFGLEKDYPEIMNRAINKRISYDPRKEPLPVAIGSSERISAPAGRQELVNAKLVKY